MGREKSMSKLRKIQGFYCGKCNHTIFSRAKHDFRACACWKRNSINEGVVVSGDKLMPGSKGESLDIETSVDEWELYDDWNYRRDKFGLHFGKLNKVTRERR